MATISSRSQCVKASHIIRGLGDIQLYPIMLHHNSIQYNMISYRPLQWLKQNINQSLNPWKTPHISPSEERYRMSFVWILEQNGHVIPISQIAKFMGPTWGPLGSCRPQMGPILAPWTLLSLLHFPGNYSVWSPWKLSHKEATMSPTSFIRSFQARSGLPVINLDEGIWPRGVALNIIRNTHEVISHGCYFWIWSLSLSRETLLL